MLARVVVPHPRRLVREKLQAPGALSRLDVLVPIGVTLQDYDGVVGTTDGFEMSPGGFWRSCRGARDEFDAKSVENGTRERR